MTTTTLTKRSVLETHFLHTAKPICDVLGVSRRTLYRLIETTNIPVTRAHIAGKGNILVAILPVLQLWHAEYCAGVDVSKKK